MIVYCDHHNYIFNGKHTFTSSILSRKHATMAYAIFQEPLVGFYKTKIFKKNFKKFFKKMAKRANRNTFRIQI